MRRGLGILTCCMFALPAAAAAQVVWDAPAMMYPAAPSGLSVLLLDVSPGDGLGAVAMWRRAPAPTGLGFRVGIAEDAANDVAVMLGLDISGPLAAFDGGGSPGLIWWSGAGVGIGNEVIASFPIGIALGWAIRDEGVTFSPNVGGHMTLDVLSGPGDDLNLAGSADLGVDLGFSNGVIVRFGASVGDRDAIGVGVRLPR